MKQPASLTWSTRPIGMDLISAEKTWDMLGEAFNPRPLAFASIGIVLLCLSGLSREPQIWQLIWSLSALALLGVRIQLARAFRRRAASDGPERWATRFLYAAAATGAQWGLGGLGLLSASDPSVKILIFAVLSALITAAAARTYFLPLATITSVSIASLGIAVPSLLQLDVVIAIGFMLYICFQVRSIRSLGALKLRQMLADRQRDHLLGMLQTANADLAEANAKLEAVTLTDALTGIANRRAFDRRFAALWEDAARRSAPLGLLLFDIDHFKRFNDTYGHPAGDRCLALVAAAAARCCTRPEDFVARYGGEEFALLLPGTDAAGVMVVAERVRLATAALDPDPVPGAQARLSVSVGVAVLDPSEAADRAAFLASADKALYQAKAEGRNRVCRAGSKRLECRAAAA